MDRGYEDADMDKVALPNRQTLLFPTDQNRSYFKDLSSADIHSVGQLDAYDRHHLCYSSIPKRQLRASSKIMSTDTVI